MTNKNRSRLKFWWLIIKHKIKYLFSNPLYSAGTHLIEAPAGTGKTLLMNIILRNTVDPCKHYMYSNLPQFDNNYIKQIDIFDMFDNGKQQYQLPNIINNKYCKGIIIDEINANFNRRLNNRAYYNDIFVGLMEFFVTHRHQGIEKIYLIGQDLSLQDIQLQQVLKYRHLVYSAKRYSYKLYLETGEIVKLPKKLKVIHYIKSSEKDNRGTPIFVPFKISKIRVDYDKHIKTYNHKGYAEKYKKLPIYPLN